MNAQIDAVNDGSLTNGEFTTAEKVGSIFQPDTLLSAQYFGNLCKRTVLEAEKRLMFAILEDAVSCYRNNVLAQRGKGKRLFEETESWILESGSDWIFSFVNVCDALGFNPEYFRRGLLRWKETSRRKQSPLRVSDKNRARELSSRALNRQ